MEQNYQNTDMRKRYQITSLLGEGGMAVVYKAFDTVLERDVAIKVIKTKDIGAAQVTQIHKRFDREVKTLAKLTHPNIVHIHDYGHAQDTPYLIMEFLPGGTLADRMKQPIPFDTAARILLPIAEALRYAHQRGILHRDVKPANILFTDDGQPMLSDFGIAKILGVETEKTGEALTQTGMGIGTPEYMAPEQWHGNFTDKTDMYALGIVYYEMITGRKPYMANTPAAQLIKQMTEDVPAPSLFIHGLPSSVEQFLLTLLAREPADRCQDMSEVIENLHALTSNRAATVNAGMDATDINLPSSLRVAKSTQKQGAEAQDRAMPAETEMEIAQLKPARENGKKIARGVGNIIRNIVIIITSIALIVAILVMIGVIYVTGLFSKQAIQNAGYDNVYREENYRITETQLNADIDDDVMPYFEDFVQDINANIQYPDTVDFIIRRKGIIHTLHVTAQERDGYIAFKVDTFNDFPLIFIRGILSSQFTRGMRNVLDEQNIEITDLHIDNNEIYYTVRPK